MRSLLSIFIVILLCSAAEADSTIHGLPTQATVPIPANSCLYVDQGPGTPAALCNQYATAIGAQGNATVTKTGNYTVLGTDNGTTFDNTGAGGEVDFTLPTESGNLNYTFCVVASQTVKVIAPTGVKIAIGASNSAAAGNVSNATPFGCVTLYSPTAATTQWVARSSTGTWTVT